MLYRNYILVGAFIICFFYVIYHIVNTYLDSPKKTPESVEIEKTHYPLVPFRGKLIFQDKENYMFLFVQNNNIVTLGKIPKHLTNIVYINNNEEPYLEKKYIKSYYLSKRKSLPKKYYIPNFKYELHCSESSISNVDFLSTP